MNFAEFLCHLMEVYQCKSGAALFEKLGGSNKLDMSIRNFNHLISGHSIPSVRSLVLLSECLDERFQKQALLSFLNSNNVGNDSKLADFISRSRTNEFKKPKEKIGPKSKSEVISADVLEELSKSSAAVRLYIKLVLEDKIKINEIRDENLAEKFSALGLAKINKGDLMLAKKYTRLPNPENSSAGEVKEANNFIFQSLKALLAFEGSESQTFNFATLNIAKESAVKIQQELLALNKKIVSLSEAETSSATVPMVYISFSRKLSEKDLR